MRLGDLPLSAPAVFMIACSMKPVTPRESSGLGGALVSATSTSPFGRRYSQRGWSRFSAKAVTFRPDAAVGFSPAAHFLLRARR